GSLDPTSIQIATPPSTGTAIANSDGTITFAPAPGFFGPVSFTYVVSDDRAGSSNAATVTVTVTVSVNPDQPPVANDDSATAFSQTSTAIDVLSNDADADDGIDYNSIVITSGPANGTVQVNFGFVTYTSNAGFAGTDTFQYTVKDYAGLVSNVATVTMT